MLLVFAVLLGSFIVEVHPLTHTLLDPRLIAWESNTAYQLGPVSKSPANPLLSEDKPWDGNWLNSNPSVVFNNGTFHLWWTAKLVCPGATPDKCSRAVAKKQCCHPDFNFSIPSDANSSGGLLYANSSDGITWTKPSLGLNTLLGSTENNAVFVKPGGGASQMGIC